MSKELIRDNLFIEDLLTPMTELEAAYALQQGWKLALGTDASLNQIGCLWSQSYLETAGWKSIHCWNWGNIKKTTGHAWTMYPCHEYLADGSKQKFFPPHIQTGFNAYADAVQGAKEYIEFLKNRTRYKDAWAGLMEGDLAKFNRGLKKGGYYTAPEDAYLKTLTSYFKKFQKNSKDLLTYVPPVTVKPEPVEPKEIVEPEKTNPAPVEAKPEPVPAPPASKVGQEPTMWDNVFKFIHELLVRIK